MSTSALGPGTTNKRQAWHYGGSESSQYATEQGTEDGVTPDEPELWDAQGVKGAPGLPWERRSFSGGQEE